ncbi:MAG TPA: redoxin domain-containing protein [Pirellulales bacterium]|jgi:peroxiredoxin
MIANLRFRGAMVLVMLSCAWCSPVASGAEASDVLPKCLGQKSPDFRLPDASGQEHALADLQDARLVVVAFLGTECPLAKLYGPRLEHLAAQYAERGVRVLGIDANVQDTPDEVGAYAHEHGITFPLLVDRGNMIADKLGATRTPEVFLLDEKRVVRYQGRIDDQFGIGVQKAKPTRQDLATAIDELLAGGNVSQPELPAPGCFIGRVTRPAADAEITYSRQIARIFQRHCVECHREGEIGPFAMTSYAEVVGWGETIREVVDQGRMPPWFADPKHGKFVNDQRLSDEEKRQITQWVASGCPEGDPAEQPAPRTFVDGWNIPQPDVVFKMRAEPYQVPAEGVVDYQHYVIDPGFTEDKWSIASEARPGNHSVVHHILVFLHPPGQPLEIGRGSLLAAYAPGSPPRQVQKGMAKRIPAGSKIIMQVHYTPNGRPQQDLSSLGLVLCDAKDVKQEVESGWAVNFAIAIPPGMANYKSFSMHRFEDDRLLLILTPHMHMRGKSFRYEAWYPTGKREVLLDVPRWDFNWQIDYVLAEPKLMPKGTQLRCFATYDNSPSNPANPDPNKWVFFGEQSWDEMMMGWFTAATLPPSPQAGPTEVTGGQ